MASRSATPSSAAAASLSAPTLVVSRRRERVAHAAVGDDDRRRSGQRDRCRRLCSAIDRERVAGEAQRADELIHDPAAHADERVLRGAGGPRERAPVERHAGEVEQRGARGELQRGRGREPRTDRHARRHGNVGAAQRDAGVAERRATPSA